MTSLWCIFVILLLLLIILFLIFRLLRGPQLVQAPPQNTAVQKLIDDPPNAVVPEQLPNVTKFILLVCGSYPLAITIIRDNQRNYKFVPTKDLARAKQNGAMEVFSEGNDTSDIIVAWRNLVTVYLSAKFQPDWGFAAIKPFSKQELNNAIDAIKLKYPNLKAIVLQYLGHGDSESTRPFLSIRGKVSLKVSSTGPTVTYPSDSVVADKYFTEDLRNKLRDTFTTSDHITIVVDGCELAKTLEYAVPPTKIRVVVCEKEVRVCNEGLFSRFYSESALLDRSVYDDYASKMAPILAEVNQKLARSPIAAGTSAHEAAKNP